MARCCSPCDEVQSRGGGYAIHDCLVSATMFLEFWKRKQAEIQYDWDVADFEMEEVNIWIDFMTN